LDQTAKSSRAIAIPIRQKPGGQTGAASEPAGGLRNDSRNLRALEIANENLQRANSQLEEFAYVASHDLREPLRMVNIYSELLIEECGPASAQARQFGQHIRENVARMEELIEDVLQYSQVIHNAREDPGASLPLRRSLEHALAVFGDRLDAAGARINIDDLPVVIADEMNMALVFQNLISNSLKYAHPERKLSIRIWAARTGNFWTTYFADNGIGFEPQFAERIFGLFKRLHGREVPGTGLGLAICRRIIERYGGCIRAESSPQGGATFIFTLKGSEHHGADSSCRGQSR
jgi:light-regulated signal transduction histidine kinase (bacteriophytochrome)